MGGNSQVNLLAKHTKNRGGEGGGGRVSWVLKEVGKSQSRNFCYRTMGPPPGYYHCFALVGLLVRPSLLLGSLHGSRQEPVSTLQTWEWSVHGLQLWNRGGG